jgi:type IV pilus assembly protein PilQ
MLVYLKRLFVVIWLVFYAFFCQGQTIDRIVKIQYKLEALAIDLDGLEQTVELSVSNTSGAEFIRGIAATHELNASISPDVNFTISNNFSNAKVIDVFLFLCKEYNLDIDIIGSIINFKLYQAPVVVEVLKQWQPTIPKVSFQQKGSLISLELKNDSLGKVVQELTKKSGLNVILGPDVDPSAKINLFISKVPFEIAINKLAYANGLEVKHNEDDIYVIEKINENNFQYLNDKQRNQNKKSRSSKNQVSGTGELYLEVNEFGKLLVEANDVQLEEIIESVSREFGKNYFLFSKPTERVTLYIENATYDAFLTYLLTGSKYTHQLKDDVYIIGDRSLENLRTSEIYRFKYRTVENIINILPNELKQGVQIAEFRDLNALVLSGGTPQIAELKRFIQEIDQVVPMIQIEVLIVDFSQSSSLSFGLSATLGGDNVPSQTSGTILPEYNMTMNSQSINSLINNFNGFGMVNIGKVSPQFYINLNALEQDGVIKLRSTPKLSTLNGQEAVLSIGQTEYYLQVRNDYIGAQNPSLSRQENWQPVNANLSVTINPIVSSDGYVTLEIGVAQSSFTERVSSTAPPGSVNKDFQSTIRVKNGEMILLGGLEGKSSSNSGDGLPFLSRIPVIKWFFSRRIKANKNTKFNLFIKPTIF